MIMVGCYFYLVAIQKSCVCELLATQFGLLKRENQFVCGVRENGTDVRQ